MNEQQRQSYMKTYRKAYSASKKRINATATLQQYEQLAKAARPDESVPAVTLRLALERLREAPKVPEINTDTAKELTRLVRTMSNNLNQVAHHLNSSRQIWGPGGAGGEGTSAASIAAMQEQLACLEQDIYRLLTLSPPSR